MNQSIEVTEIVKDWLTSHGYDGLYDGEECGCYLEDFAPCGEPQGRCMAAYKIERNGETMIVLRKDQTEELAP